ncbi:zinc finger BED domain-containing protein RICESLEEPER 2 [Tanacetum coccineum]
MSVDTGKTVWYRKHSVSESKPQVVVKKSPNAKSIKRKSNDKEEEEEEKEEEYEIYEKTSKERVAYWENYDPVRMKNDPNTRRSLCKFCKKTLVADGLSNDNIEDDVLNDMVTEMVKKVVPRMEDLFKTYKTSKAYGGDNDFVYDFLNLEESDLLPIQITNVASNSAFSTGGRVLDPYRTNLSYLVVEALICTQDWVRKSRKDIIDDIGYILNDDDVSRGGIFEAALACLRALLVARTSAIIRIHDPEPMWNLNRWIKKIEEITEIDGVDCVHMRPTNLSTIMGYLRNRGNKQVKEMMTTAEKDVLKTTRKWKDKDGGGGAYLGGIATPFEVDWLPGHQDIRVSDRDVSVLKRTRSMMSTTSPRRYARFEHKYGVFEEPWESESEEMMTTLEKGVLKMTRKGKDKDGGGRAYMGGIATPFEVDWYYSLPTTL